MAIQDLLKDKNEQIDYGSICKKYRRRKIKMIKIKNKKLYQELKEKPEWETLFSDNQGTLKDARIPILSGLDHIEITSKGIAFIDVGKIIGISSKKDNSFMIVK